MKDNLTGGKEAQKLFTSGKLITQIYETLVSILMEQGKINEAIKYLDMGNNEMLKDKFKNMQMATRDTTELKAIEKHNEIKKELELVQEELVKEKSKPQAQRNADLIKKLEEIQVVTQNKYMTFINDIMREMPTLKEKFVKTEHPLYFRSQKKMIPEDMAVLLYLVTDNNLYIFAGSRDSVFAKVIKIDKSEIEDRVYQLYSLVKRPINGFDVRGTRNLQTGEEISNSDKFRNLSQDLYDILINPVINEIGNKKKIAIIPNGILYYLPFQILGKEADGKFNYLISDFSISYSNKLNYLNPDLYISDDELKLLAIGNADNTLPFAEQEVQTISKVFRNNPMILIGSQATKDKIFNLTENYNVLHFATHGMLDYNNFESSYLVLANDPESGDDGKLKIEEIYGISSIENCQMVTLSACETAVTLGLQEGWPITTASAFLEVGVPSVIASLWSVDDKATSILMEEFYRELGKTDKLEALRNAQLKLMQTEGYNQPYYWAPFLLVGNWK